MREYADDPAVTGRAPRATRRLIDGRSHPALRRLQVLEAELEPDAARAMREGEAPADIVKVVSDACNHLGIDPAQLSRSTFPKLAYALELHGFDDAVDTMERTSTKRAADKYLGAARRRRHDQATKGGR